MRPLIKDMQKIPPLFPAILAPQTAWGMWLRNSIFALVSWSRIIEFSQRFSVGAFASIDKYKLPDYEWIS